MIIEHTWKTQELLDLHMAGHVKRWHTNLRVESESIAHHSWGVALLILRLHPKPTVELLKAAIYHDMAESVVGDIPATAKWQFPALSASVNVAETYTRRDMGVDFTLEGDENSWLKWCDMLDLCFSAYEELQLGNRYAMEALKNGVTALSGSYRAPPQITVIADELLEMAQEMGL